MRRCPHCGSEKNPAWSQTCQDCGKPLYELPSVSSPVDNVGSPGIPKDESKPSPSVSSHQFTQSAQETNDWESESLPTSPQVETFDQNAELGSNIPPVVTPLDSTPQPRYATTFDSLFSTPGNIDAEQSPPPSPHLHGQEPVSPRPQDVAPVTTRPQEYSPISRVARSPAPGSLLIGQVTRSNIYQRQRPIDWSKRVFYSSMAIAVLPFFAVVGVIGLFVSCVGALLIALISVIVSVYVARRQSTVPVLELQVLGASGQLTPVYVIEPSAGSDVGIRYEVAVHGQWDGQQIRAYRIELLAAVDPTTSQVRPTTGEVRGRRPFPSIFAVLMTIAAIALWIWLINALSDLFS